ncbi:MAG: hypothetical protein FJ298_06210 [Planctomycetes bacterium]|nr:hypothetical protein [Planctomycetota bacterium]
MTDGDSHDHTPSETRGHSHAGDHSHAGGHGHGDPYVWQPPERRSRIGWWLLGLGAVLVAAGLALAQWAGR